MSANNQHECEHKECDNSNCLLSCIDEGRWETQDEFDALPDDTLILSQLSMMNPRLEKFDSIPILHTKKSLSIAITDYKKFLEENGDCVMIENLYEDIKKYNVKSAENITCVNSRPTEKYAVWRKWITQYVAHRVSRGSVVRGAILNKFAYLRYMEKNGPFTIMMTNDDDNICLMTTAHYFGLIKYDPNNTQEL